MPKALHREMKLEVRDTLLYSVQQRTVIPFKRRVFTIQTSLHYNFPFSKKILSSGAVSSGLGDITVHGREITGKRHIIVFITATRIKNRACLC
jgi:hypothetical protein